MKVNTKLCAAFCGTGKSSLCKKFPDTCIEFECWEYQSGDFPDNYIRDIVSMIGKIKYIFISTNPIVLKQLNCLGYNIDLFYPDNKLKSEYFKRFANRNDHIDFIITMNIYWDMWLNELKEQNYSYHTVLKSEEHLEDVIQKDEECRLAHMCRFHEIDLNN